MFEGSQNQIQYEKLVYSQIFSLTYSFQKFSPMRRLFNVVPLPFSGVHLIKLTFIFPTFRNVFRCRVPVWYLFPRCYRILPINIRNTLNGVAILHLTLRPCISCFLKRKKKKKKKKGKLIDFFRLYSERFVFLICFPSWTTYRRGNVSQVKSLLFAFVDMYTLEFHKYLRPLFARKKGKLNFGTLKFWSARTV